MVELETGPVEDTDLEAIAGWQHSSDVPDSLVRLWALRALDELNVCPMKARLPERVRLCQLITTGGEPFPCTGEAELCDRSSCPVKAMRASAEASGQSWDGKLCAAVDRFGEHLGLDPVERGILAILVVAENDRRMMDLFHALGPVKLRHGKVVLAIMLGCTRDQVSSALAEGATLPDLGLIHVAPDDEKTCETEKPRTVIDLDRLEEHQRAFSYPGIQDEPDDEEDGNDGDDDDGTASGQEPGPVEPF